MAKRHGKASLRPGRTGWKWIPAALALALGIALLVTVDGQRRAARLVPLAVVQHTLAPTATPGPEAPPTSVSADESGEAPAAEVTYVLNTNTRRFHRPDCPSVQDMKAKNRRDFTGDREEGNGS